MLDKSASIASRVVTIKRTSPVLSQPLTLPQQSYWPLPQVLAGLRSEVDVLTTKLAREHGVASEATVRAEQISHAIQRLEWVLARQNTESTAS